MTRYVALLGINVGDRSSVSMAGEFVVDGVAVPTQKPFRMAYLALVTVGEEGITSYRDYWSRKAAEGTMSGDAQTLGQALAVDAQ